MKKLFTILAAALCGTAGAFAQFCPTLNGAVYSYTDHKYGENASTSEARVTVTSVSTDDQGSTTVEMLEKTIAATLTTEPDSRSSAIFTTPDAPTTYIMINPETFKELICESIRNEIASSGQAVSESDLQQVLDQIRPTGKVQLILDPNAAEGSKIPNASLRVSVAMMNMSIHISGGKVLGRESVEVPAGTFDNCLKVSYIAKQNMGDMTEKTYITEWYADGVGVVKQEGRDKRGELINDRILNSITLP